MRSLTSEELRALRPGDFVNAELLGGKILRLRFVSFAAGGNTGDTFARLFAEEKLMAIDPERLLTLA